MPNPILEMAIRNQIMFLLMIKAMKIKMRNKTINATTWQMCLVSHKT